MARKRRSRDFTYTASRDGLAVVVHAAPHWAAALCTAADLLCAATGHRYCNALAGRAFDVYERVSLSVTIPCDVAKAREVHEMMALADAWPAGTREWIWDDVEDDDQ